MEQILQEYGIVKKTVTAIMLLYRTRKQRFAYLIETDFFNIVARVLQGDTLTPYLFIICLDNVLRTSTDQIKENDFTLKKKKKAKSRRYPAETITDADYADDLALLANTCPSQI